MRALAGLVPAALLLSLAAPSAADHDRSFAHDFRVEATTLDLQQAADLTRLAVDFNVTEPDPFSEGEACEDSQVHVDPEAGTFTFNDTEVTDGCADVQLPVAVPPGAQRLVVSFEANRVITQGGGLPVGGAGSLLLQRFRILGADGSIAFAKDYFDDTEGSQPEPEPFVIDEALGLGEANLTLSWLFDDQGFQGERLSTLQDFDATVGAISLHWPGIALPPPRVVEGEEEATNDTVAAAPFNVTIDLPPLGLRAGDNASLTLVTQHGPVLRRLTGPAGDIPLQAATRSDDGERLAVTLPADVLLQHGAGDYTLGYESQRQLEPPDGAPDEPTTVFALYYMMLLLPAPAALLALSSALVYRRESHGRYRRASAWIVTLVLAATAYYLALVAYAVLVAGRTRMATLPLRPEATFLYAQLLLILLVLAVMAIVVGRYLVRAMRQDLEARRRQEESLRRSNEELERFAYVASHDLQEPLRKVAGFTSLLQRRYKGRLDKDADEMIQYAVDGATRMQALIRDILAYSRVGSVELDPKPVAPADVLTLVVADLGESINETKAQVTWDGLPLLAADASQLRQVLQNLVENAIKYRHPNRRPKVRITAERDGPMWRFAVADNGLGIPADKLHEVFGIFRRLHGSEVPGTGIGLALAKKAIERHGGRIWVESRMGKGSTFYFTLPAAPDPTGGGLLWTTPSGLRAPKRTEPAGA